MPRPLNDKWLGPLTISALETASSFSAKVPVCDTGVVVGMKCTQSAATDGSPIITVLKNGVTMTGAPFLIPIGPAGAVTEADFSPNDTTLNVSEGDEISVVTAGNGTTGGVGTFMILIRT